MKNLPFIALLLLFTCSGFTQNTLNSELDFWLGEWNLHWQDADSTEATGTNRIVRELDGQVICEYFKAETGAYAGFTGRSWSMYDSRSQIWKQTWVDNQGSYLDFTGGKEGDGFVFRREFSGKNGMVVKQKMVFHDILSDRFTWDWMRSTDGGKEWQLMWRVHYSRR